MAEYGASMALLHAAAGPGDTGWTSNRLLLVVVAALLGFMSGYLLELYKGRKTPRRVLSWDLKIEEPKLIYRAANADRLKMSYNGRSVDRLVSVRYAVTNTGNTTIKDQYLRFDFPIGAEILEKDYDPAPPPEMGVADVTGEDPRYSGLRYKVGHLEPGQSVTFFFTANAGEWSDWKGVVPHNEEGGVHYQQRDVSQRRDDQEHIAPFLFGITALVVVTLLALALFVAFTIFGRLNLVEFAFFSIVIALTVLFAAGAANLLTHAFRATRAISAALSGLSAGGLRVQTFGENNFVAHSDNGVVRVTVRKLHKENGDEDETSNDDEPVGRRST